MQRECNTFNLLKIESMNCDGNFASLVVLFAIYYQIVVLRLLRLKFPFVSGNYATSFLGDGKFKKVSENVIVQPIKRT